MFLRKNYSKAARHFIYCEVAEQPAKVVVFLLLSTVTALLEVTGIALIFPLLYIIIEPESVDRFSALVWLKATLGLETRRGLYVLLIVMIASILVAKNVYMGAFNYFQLRVLARRKTALSRRLIRIYMYSDFSIHMYKTSSEVIRNLGLTGMIYDQFILSWIRILTNAVVAAGLVSLLLYILPSQAAMSTAALGGAAIAMHFSLKRFFIRLGKQSNELFKLRQRLLQQSIGAVKDTKVLGKEGFFVENFTKVERSYFDNQRHSNFLTLLPVLVSESIAILAVLVLVGYVVAFSEHSTQIIATLGILAATMFRIAPLFNRILSSFQLVEMSKHGLEIVASELEEFEPQLYVPNHEVERLPLNEGVRLEDVGYRYPGAAQWALRNVSFEIGINEFIGITGSSGAGKSTLLAVIMGLLRPDEGRVLVDREPLLGPERVRRWQSAIGYVPQGIFLTEDSVRNNIAFGVEPENIVDARMRRAVELASLNDFVNRLERGLDDSVGENGSRVSGGERQRLGIARALYVEPDFLSFDEATSSLDVETERSVADNMLAFRGQRTMVAIAHRLSTLRNCDKIVMMDNGAVLDVGTFDELEERCEQFRHLVQLSRLTSREGAVA